MEEFHKVRRLPPYVFEQVNRLKASARAQGADIIDLGMGNPDLPTPTAIVDKLCEVVRDPRTHRYSSSRGIPGLRRAQANYYARRFGVKLNPDTHVVATLGSKEGFANMAQAITAPVASLDFYKDVVAFAKKNDIIILSDLAYSEIYFEGDPPPSVLQVPGAIDVCVEFTSMSKTFSMPGWRMGFAVGNERLIS